MPPRAAPQGRLDSIASRCRWFLGSTAETDLEGKAALRFPDLMWLLSLLICALVVQELKVSDDYFQRLRRGLLFVSAAAASCQ